MTTVSTHVLDAARGLPATGLAATLTGPLTAPERLSGSDPDPGSERPRRRPAPAPPAARRTAATDGDGRIAWGEVPGPGTYTLELATGDWFAAQDRETFYPRVVLEVAVGAAHTHVALLLSPFAYTTYRGS